MTREDFAQFQSENAIQAMHALAMLCRRRFLRSADLVELKGTAIEALRKFGVSQAIDLAPLLPAWRLLCDRYLAERFDPQLNLFGKPATDAIEAWQSFVHQELFEAMVRDDSLVRNVLRSLGGLPCRSPAAAADAVYQYVAEMALPSGRPPWAPEDVID